MPSCLAWSVKQVLTLAQLASAIRAVTNVIFLPAVAEPPPDVVLDPPHAATSTAIETNTAGSLQCTIFSLPSFAKIDCIRSFVGW
jgi:hypothetical protein